MPCSLGGLKYLRSPSSRPTSGLVSNLSFLLKTCKGSAFPAEAPEGDILRIELRMDLQNTGLEGFWQNWYPPEALQQGLLRKLAVEDQLCLKS